MRASSRKVTDRPPIGPAPFAGAGYGLAVGAAFLAFVLGNAVLTGGQAMTASGLTPWSAAAVFLGGGLVGGTLVGLLLPLARWRIGAGVLGAIGLFPAISGISIAIDGPHGFASPVRRLERTFRW